MRGDREVVRTADACGQAGSELWRIPDGSGRREMVKALPHQAARHRIGLGNPHTPGIPSHARTTVRWASLFAQATATATPRHISPGGQPPASARWPVHWSAPKRTSRAEWRDQGSPPATRMRQFDQTRAIYCRAGEPRPRCSVFPPKICRERSVPVWLQSLFPFSLPP